MEYFPIVGEPYGEIGDATVWTDNRHGDFNSIEKLSIEIQYWGGEDILDIDGFNIITDRFAQKLNSAKLSGYEIEQVQIEVSERMEFHSGATVLPKFFLHKVTGREGIDDFFFKEYGKEEKADILVVSERVIEILTQLDESYTKLIRHNAEVFVRRLERG